MTCRKRSSYSSGRSSYTSYSRARFGVEQGYFLAGAVFAGVIHPIKKIKKGSKFSPLLILFSVEQVSRCVKDSGLGPGKKIVEMEGFDRSFEVGREDPQIRVELGQDLTAGPAGTDGNVRVSHDG